VQKQSDSFLAVGMKSCEEWCCRKDIWN